VAVLSFALRTTSNTPPTLMVSPGCSFLVPFPVDERSVLAAQVFEGDFLSSNPDPGVVAGDQRCVQMDRSVLAASDDVLAFRQRILPEAVDDERTGRAVRAGDGSDELVAATRQRLDVPRLLRVVPQGLSDLGDGPAQRLLADDDIRPDLLEQRLSGQQSSRCLNEMEQQLEAFRPQLDALPVATQLPCVGIELKRPEKECPAFVIAVQRRRLLLRARPHPLRSLPPPKPSIVSRERSASAAIFFFNARSISAVYRGSERSASNHGAAFNSNATSSAAPSSSTRPQRWATAAR
jgi:hypothetical protein